MIPRRACEPRNKVVRQSTSDKSSREDGLQELIHPIEKAVSEHCPQERSNDIRGAPQPKQLHSTHADVLWECKGVLRRNLRNAWLCLRNRSRQMQESLARQQ